MVDLDSRLRVPDGVLLQVIGEESVILNLNSENYFGLDGVGTRFWAVLVNSGSVGSAMDALLEEFEVDATKLRADLADFVAQLVDAGLLEVDPGDRAS